MEAEMLPREEGVSEIAEVCIGVAARLPAGAPSRNLREARRISRLRISSTRLV